MKNLYNFKQFERTYENFIFEQYEMPFSWNNSPPKDTDNSFFKYIKNFKYNDDGIRINMPFTKKEYDNIINKYEYNTRIHTSGYDIKVTSSNRNDFKYFGEVPTHYHNIKYIYAVKKYLDKIKNKNIKFCDMGCGSGNVVYFANKMGYDAMGIELQKEKLEPRHKELGINVIYGDFFNLDLSFLKDVDVIYLYRPIENEELSTKLLDLIYSNTKDDVIVIYDLPNRIINNFERLNHDGIAFLIKNKFK